MKTIAETTGAILQITTDGNANELRLDAKDQDCPMYRGSTPEGPGTDYCVAFAGDRRPASGGGAVQMAYMGIKAMPDGSGAIEFYAKDAGGNGDGDMIRLARLSVKGFELFVPFLGVAPSAKLTQIALRAHANGKFVCAEAEGGQALIANRDQVGAWETFDVVPV